MTIKCKKCKKIAVINSKYKTAHCACQVQFMDGDKLKVIEMKPNTYAIIERQKIVTEKIALQPYKEPKRKQKNNNNKRYEIWSEGYQTTGQSAGATHLGYSFGRTFKDACNNFAKLNKNFAEYYDKQTMDYWGCDLFDNESDARKSFG